MATLSDIEPYEKQAKASLWLIVILVFALVEFFRHGIFVRDYIFLFIGSLMSILCLILYGSFLHGLQTKTIKRGQKSWLNFFLVSTIWVPYLFTVYLVFYRGIWQLTNLLHGFSILIVISSAFFIFVGLKLINVLEPLTRQK
jgi:hypothetical protein